MKVGVLVFSKNFERGIVERISPSGFLVSVKFKNYGLQTVLSGSLTVIK